MDFQRLGDLFADAEYRIECGRRVLEDHRHTLTAHSAQAPLVGGRHVGAPEPDRPGNDLAGLLEPDTRQRCNRLAAATFANDTDDFALFDGERGALDSMDGSVSRLEVRLQVSDFEEPSIVGHPAGSSRTALDQVPMQ